VRQQTVVLGEDFGQARGEVMRPAPGAVCSLTAIESPEYDAALFGLYVRIVLPLTAERTMAAILQYGHCHALELDLPADRLVAEFLAPTASAISDPAATVAAELSSPLDFPPLSQATVPGDRVAVALDPSVPRPAAIVAGLVQALLDCDIRPADIAIVEPAVDYQPQGPDPRGDLPTVVADEVRRVIHNPRDRQQLSYLAASTAGRPIYLNQTLHDAELVIPINCLRPSRSLGDYGKHSGLFPAFSDQETIDRFRQPDRLEMAADRQRWTSEVDEVGWLLGVAVAIAAVPAAAGQALHILSGEVESIYRQGQLLADAAWAFQVPHRAGLVVASIGPNAAEPTWHDVARGLAAAEAIVADGGATVICTDLKTDPGPALRRISDAEDLDMALAEACRDTSADARMASELIRALLRGRVYLMSNVDPELVEQAGMAPVSNDAEIAHLARQHESCILLSHAQLVAPTALDDPGAIWESDE
jgi:lactate racemase